MGLFNKLINTFDSHVEAVVSEQVQKRQQDIVRQVCTTGLLQNVVREILQQRQQDIVRQVKQEIEASDQSWKKVDEAWKGEVEDLQHVVDRLDSEMDDLKDTVEMQCVDADYVQERVEEIDTLDEYTILDRIDTRVTEILENATVTIEPNI